MTSIQSVKQDSVESHPNLIVCLFESYYYYYYYYYYCSVTPRGPPRVRIVHK